MSDIQPVDRSQRVLADGSPEVPGYERINPATGMQREYVVLSEEERAKGFVRPVRRSYKHVGAGGPKRPLRDLTPEEHERFDRFGYAKFEAYPESESPVTGKFWTEKELATIGGGCGVVTTMSPPIAETYARDPGFYGSTFCCGCRTHLPVAEFIWEGTDERVGS